MTVADLHLKEYYLRCLKSYLRTAVDRDYREQLAILYA